MNGSNRWAKIWMTCAVALMVGLGREGHAQTSAAPSDAPAAQAAMAECVGRFGELTAAAAQCFARALSPEQLERCMAFDDAADRCFGANPVMVSWMRMRRDVTAIQRVDNRFAKVAAASFAPLMQAQDSSAAVARTSPETTTATSPVLATRDTAASGETVLAAATLGQTAERSEIH